MVRLGFRAFDPHELLVHFVAQRAELYQRAEVEVELVDLRAGEAAHDASCACGTALFQALEGAPVEILLVASAAPLFWLYCRDSAFGGDGRVGLRVATYPQGAPPARFLELALDSDARFVPARDDAARLALVSRGEANCALLSSATPPNRVPDGLRPRFCLADRVPVPSTGIATSRRGDSIHRLVEAHRQALMLLARDLPVSRAVMREDFGFTDDEAVWALEQTRRHFTTDGRVTAVDIDAALQAVGATRSPYAAGAIRYPTSKQEDHQ